MAAIWPLYDQGQTQFARISLTTIPSLAASNRTRVRSLRGCNQDSGLGSRVQGSGFRV